METHVNNKPVRRVVIAGGGTAGWMVAACLGKSLGKRLDIKLVESDEIGTVGVGEATIPTLQNFHHLLEINEQEFMAATHATFKLGISFENWRDVHQDYIHSFGNTGIDHWTAGFQHFWHKGRERGLAGDYGDYCLEHRAAQLNRFAHLPKQIINYAYHMDAGAYARFLRRFSEHYGVQRVEAKIVDVVKDPDANTIRSIKLDSGTELEGDLFIDCSGFRALLIGGALGVEYEDWSHWLFNDSAAALQTASSGEAVPYTRSIAREAGWQWRIPLQHRVGNGHVFSSRFIDDEAAIATLNKHVTGEPLMQPRVIRFQPGQRKQVWVGNCVAIGLASGFLEPIESTSIHLIQSAISRLIEFFPDRGFQDVERAEFNRQSRFEYERIRDFIVLHYHLNQRTDSPYWLACANMAIPDTLRQKMDLYRARGKVVRVDNELFSEVGWIQVLEGQNMPVNAYNPLVDVQSEADIADYLDSVRGVIAKCVSVMPTHEEYIARHCAAPKM
ncbi:MAG TPA: tryptophan halogenase [Massilia sp.]|nr:tryptophan halogenase [Massilia sp.]